MCFYPVPNWLLQELRTELTRRCGRSPPAVILRVDRQGIDGNRATGNGTHTRTGELCTQQSNGECCCWVVDLLRMFILLYDVLVILVFSFMFHPTKQ